MPPHKKNKGYLAPIWLCQVLRPTPCSFVNKHVQFNNYLTNFYSSCIVMFIISKQMYDFSLQNRMWASELTRQRGIQNGRLRHWGRCAEELARQIKSILYINSYSLSIRTKVLPNKETEKQTIRQAHNIRKDRRKSANVLCVQEVVTHFIY